MCYRKLLVTDWKLEMNGKYDIVIYGFKFNSMLLVVKSIIKRMFMCWCFFYLTSECAYTSKMM